MTSPNTVTVSQVSDVTTVEITTAGPQGATGATGATGPQGPAAAGFDFDGDNKVNGSIPVFNSSTSKFEATATHTVLTLVDGGNF